MLLQEGTNARISYLNLGDTIAKAVSIFMDLKIAIIPVLDGEGGLLSVFSRSSLYRAILDGATYKDIVDPYLIKEVISISDDLTDDQLADFVKVSPVGSVPVVNREGKVLGLLCKANMVMTLFRHSELLNVQLKAILDSMHNGVIAVDSQGIVTHFNIGATRILGSKADTSLGQPFKEFLPNLDLNPALIHGEVQIGLKYRRHNITMVVNITPLNIGGSIAGGIIIFQDLTDLEQAARELETVKALNKTFDTVLNIIHDGIIVVDERGKTTLINHAMADFLSLSSEEVIGKHITDIMETSRLHIVASTGISETSDVLTIQGKPLIVSRMPIIREGKVVGAVGKAVFPQLAEVQELVEKLRFLENKVTFFQEELQKNKTAQDIMKGIVAESAEMKKLKEEISIVASSSSTVLITGESGTGKEGVAHAVHLCSDRCKGPFIKVNCAAIPENLMEAEMFGYVAGAFTGAAKAGKPGRLEMADGGTLFLDEIGDMPLALQSKLLRVLQDREFERLGGTKSIKVNVRILAATNKNLNKAISEGEFRADLYYRLNVINLHLPPLRERAEDIEALTHFFITKFNHILKGNVMGIVDDAMKTLLNYSWPGNIRELENVVERAVNYTRSGLIQLTHLPNQILTNSSSESEVITGTIRHQDKIGRIERNMIVVALEKAGGNKTKAAKLLNLSRSRLYDKLSKYDLNY
ncbi:sigma 54-interacting transcriptional regulator [Desulfosporosinus metallidurans]|uniref:Transcriptional regulator BkdR of isoleucine and valine catabolism operon n=1 Tax=Desulfosporosinus metallidurans TaxID=1888891 RepID=A0A1Q8QTV6_9FIRM|nr:sigma 54-interacting transcriptional regulator [Desulfosporosinus metallidurans]OLN30774.1 Transcriptional regulator BkdR of isoleucine and valine catabolism operon [Desulfosporosinus metallidurans]